MSSLKGKIIITTCARDKAETFKKLLEPKGAQLFNFPLISIEPAKQNTKIILKYLSAIDTYDWIVFTSTNGVKYFFYWLEGQKAALKNSNLKFAVIGNSTNRELEKHGFKAEFVGESKDSKEFAKQLNAIFHSKAQKVLLPTGNLAMQNIEDALRANHNLEKLIVYATIESNSIIPELSERVLNNEYNLILFLSPSAVRGFVQAISNKVDLKQIKAVPIGNTSKKALATYGIKTVFVPKIPTIEVMIDEIETYYNTNQIHLTN